MSQKYCVAVSQKYCASISYPKAKQVSRTKRRTNVVKTVFKIINRASIFYVDDIEHKWIGDVHY